MLCASQIIDLSKGCEKFIDAYTYTKVEYSNGAYLYDDGKWSQF